MFAFINLPVSNPCNPVNDRVSLNMFIFSSWLLMGSEEQGHHLSSSVHF